MTGRPEKHPAEKARQFNVRFPPEIHEFLDGKKNKSKLIIEAMRKCYKIKPKQAKK